MKNLPVLIIIFLFVGCKNQNNQKKIPVDEKTFVSLNGEQQYIEVKGASNDLPLLLFLHGGPGWPQTPHLRYFNSDLAKEMILVSWDQAGCGRSYMQNPNPKNLSAESLVNDAHELTQYLKKKYNKQKIFLLGFSYGSVIGLQLANKYPGDYYAYIGVSQIINFEESWNASMKWLKEQATIRNDSNTLKQLELIQKKDSSICKTKLDCFMSKYLLLVNYNATIFNKDIAKEIEKAEGFYEDYKGYNWFGAFNYTSTRLQEKQFSTDLNSINSLNIPVYFMAGRHDWNLPGIVAEDHFNKMSAPKKEFIWFERSGHEPPEEEATKFNDLVIRIVKGNG